MEAASRQRSLLHFSQEDLIDRLPVAAYAVRGPDGVIAWYNSRAAQMWGRRPEIGDLDERFCGAFRLYYSDGSFMAHSDTPVADALKSGASVHGQDVIIERPDGSRVTVCVHIDAVRDDTGAIVGVTNFFYDVTERRAREIGIRAQADQLEVAVQQRTASLGELSRRLLRMQDDERRRLSRDLHDSVGQSLTVLKMELSKGARSEGQDFAKLQDWVRLVDEAIREVRAVSYLLHPPLLDLAGLCSAIREYAAGFDKRSDMTIHVEIPERSPRLSSEQETALFRVVQECLTNAHRHSKASNVWIRVKPEDSAFRLEIEDDGQGIAQSTAGDAPETVATLGVGIRGMQERMWEYGGRLEIRSGSRGTQITASLPYKKTRTEEITGVQWIPPERFPSIESRYLEMKAAREEWGRASEELTNALALFRDLNRTHASSDGNLALRNARLRESQARKAYAGAVHRYGDAVLGAGGTVRPES